MYEDLMKNVWRSELKEKNKKDMVSLRECGGRYG